MAVIGNQTLILNNRDYKDFADGTIISVTPGGPLADGLVNKDFSLSFVRNIQNFMHTLTIRIKRGSSDDIELNKQYNSLLNNSIASLKLFEGTLSQELGDGYGNISHEVWEIKGGLINDREETIMNVGGEAGQTVIVYKILCLVKRSNQ